VFQAQYEEFLRLYGRQPAHFDGHHHMHLAANILVQRILPVGAKVRRSFSPRPGRVGIVNKCYRALVDRHLSVRYRLTDYFFALSQHLSPDLLQRIIDLAGSSDVELMTHPRIPTEYEVLMSDGYGRAISHVRLAGHDVL
jgi:predicted glycoside hydrolase/deacetylase ChbG (UPF0249 family)